MKKIVVFIVVVLIFASCKSDSKFIIEGFVDGGEGHKLYLEHVGMNAVETLDSVELSSDGKFKFRQNRPEYSPDFYRLRMKDRIVNLSVDSTEVINVKTTVRGFGAKYIVTGSLSCVQMQKLNLVAVRVKVSVDSLMNLRNRGVVSMAVFEQGVQGKLSDYKKVGYSIIYSDPKSAASYFALFQKIYSFPIFDPAIKEDLQVFGAVATSYDIYFPNNPRTKHLRNLTLQAMKAKRNVKDLFISSDKIHVASAFEIQLPDINGNAVKLSSLKGKVVVLCFTAYQADFSPHLNMLLGEIYSVDHVRGLEIYQVSLDSDENFWKVSASNIPWRCVRDRDGGRSFLLQQYNISQLPSIFLLNKAGEIVRRVEDVKNIQSEIEKLL